MDGDRVGLAVGCDVDGLAVGSDVVGDLVGRDEVGLNEGATLGVLLDGD